MRRASSPPSSTASRMPKPSTSSAWPSAWRTRLASNCTALCHSSAVRLTCWLSYSLCSQTTAVGLAFTAALWPAMSVSSPCSSVLTCQPWCQSPIFGVTQSDRKAVPEFMVLTPEALPKSATRLTVAALPSKPSRFCTWVCSEARPPNASNSTEFDCPRSMMLRFTAASQRCGTGLSASLESDMQTVCNPCLLTPPRSTVDKILLGHIMSRRAPCAAKALKDRGFFPC